MRSLPLVLLGSLVGFLAAPAGTVEAANHCASRAVVTPVPDAPGSFRIENRNGVVTIARWPSPSEEAPTALFVILARDSVFDVDGDSTTFNDTLVVPVGSTVRGQLASSIHTVTNGRDSADPESGTEFDVLLDSAHPTFDSTFTSPAYIDYFCFFHEPRMAGVVIVQSVTSVPEGARPSVVRFARPPMPNPTEGTIRFAIGIDRDERIDVSVYDAAGRRVANLHEGGLGPGIHPMEWNGRTESGRRATSGTYWVRLRGPDFEETRKFVLIR